MKLKDFDVTVCGVHGNPTMPEYGVRIDDSQRSVSGWIASTAGKAFELTYKCPPQLSQKYVAELYLDGEHATGTFFDPSNKDGTYAAGWDDPPDNADSGTRRLRRFKFVDIALGDGEENAQQPVSGSIGEIRVCIRRAIVTDDDAEFAPEQMPQDNQPPQAEIEDGIKHKIVAGDHETYPFYPVNEYEAADDSEESLDVIFYYRPLEVLREKGLVPPATAANTKDKASSRTLGKVAKKRTASTSTRQEPVDRIAELEERVRRLETEQLKRNRTATTEGTEATKRTRASARLRK
ncbi:hypothetical protein CONPUDRAFT_135894 [Coniophora puteana RWD-64-598 SS2]|uniref:DUF7918 domain-containing protein n=1 Tax=Coniophora puteana (strain RWD-64-598) TaxID=741705 RepID=A0A5M3MZP8_CONPW|nr:uncharacterized protein CONPUDRAFT_135894 [Coniophora puteana RWD-64-598 SS2]EIW84506.1 hypothetical protein CONPUDRAFT_135894 [Coniophora puteana RWD-64-598 SS2]